MVLIPDKTGSAGEGNGKPPQYSCLENPINSMKKKKDKTLKHELLTAKFRLKVKKIDHPGMT